jgi:4-hydroxythreonine-4-phosphate dehydrogenase
MALPLALTLGEPAGIGPDITLLAWLKRRELALPPFYVSGDPELLTQRAKLLELAVPVSAVAPRDAVAAFTDFLPVSNCGIPATASPGKPDATSAAVAIAAIREAVADVAAGRAAAIVTNPIAKSVLTRAGFAHPGHTEFLAELAGKQSGTSMRPVMMLWSPELAVVPVTIHQALREAIATLSTDLIVETCRIAAADLRQRFGLPVPRLALAGLNPHAGEDGTMGDEEKTIIAPAIERLRADSIAVTGPFPADTLFHAAARKTYDCAVCMYHDQALIPIKTLAFDSAVNVTLGLPFVRTSPDHGTAFDIAGTGRANPASLIEALRLAARLARVT